MAKFSFPALLGLAFLAPGISHSQAYPSRPVRLIVPYAAGGPVDSMARLLVPRLVDAWGQQIVIDNRAGANSIVGSEAAAVRSARRIYACADLSVIHGKREPAVRRGARFHPVTLVASGPRHVRLWKL